MQVGTRVRNQVDGQLGWLVEHEGRTAVRLDRAQMQLIVPYREGQWLEDIEPRLGPIQKARVLHDADRALRLAMGSYGIPDWRELKQEQQQVWMNEPKDADALRLALYRAIKKVLEGK